MDLVITISGEVRCVYDEAIDLSMLGRLRIRRGSNVEPTPDGQWTADLTAAGGPVLGPFGHRSEALTAERRWLDENWISSVE